MESTMLPQPGSGIVNEMLACLETNINDQHEQSHIARFYQQRSVFITGASGFVGKTLLEKLLRSCPKINRIYILMRPKRGKEIIERTKELTQSEIFNRIKLMEDGASQLEKIVPIRGDITLPRLGVSDEDLACMAREVSLIFHSAATIKFQEPLKIAIDQNVISVRNLFDLVVRFDNLQGLVHVSTAYSNCDRSEVEEVLYKSPIEPNRLIEMATWMDSKILERITPVLLDNRPNTYTYTKAVAESLLVAQASKLLPNLPVAIVRPSVVAGAWREPISGWVDNYNGPTGLLLSMATGLVQTVRTQPSYCIDIVPVDMVSSLLICTAWYLVSSNGNNDAGTNKLPKCISLSSSGIDRLPQDDGHTNLARDQIIGEPDNLDLDKETSEHSCITIFNCVSGSTNPLTFRQYFNHTTRAAIRYPCNNMTRFPGSRLISNYYVYFVFNFIFHKCAAHIIDFFISISGKKLKMLSIYSKLDKMVYTLVPFTTNQWKFDSTNVMRLYDKLSPIDKDLFNFDPQQISWKSYLTNFHVGAKIHVMKDNPRALPAAINRLTKLKVISNATTLTLLLVFYYFFLHGSAIENACLDSLNYLIEMK